MQINLTGNQFYTSYEYLKKNIALTMFSEMLSTIRKNQIPNGDLLQKRFDFAMTKKLGVLNLPPAFWTQDPKINPPAKELFWAALLLRDKDRIDLALAALATELYNNRSASGETGFESKRYAQQLVEDLLLLFTDSKIRDKFKGELSMIIPDLVNLRAVGESCE